MNISNDLRELFIRDLSRLRKEVECYHEESRLWLKQGQISNSAGNLALHICGNLRYFIGAILLKNGYQRDRTFEFEGQVAKSQLLAQVDETLLVIRTFFEAAEEAVFERDYPLEVFGYKMTTFSFLVHLHGHLNYHLGQINYHRRILKLG